MFLFLGQVNFLYSLVQGLAKGSEDYMRHSVWQATMGTSPRMKVLEYFLEWPGHSITAKDLAEKAGVSRPVATAHCKQLLKLGILQRAPVVWPAKPFLLNRKNLRTKALMKTFGQLILADMGEQ